MMEMDGSLKNQEQKELVKISNVLHDILEVEEDTTVMTIILQFYENVTLHVMKIMIMMEFLEDE